MLETPKSAKTPSTVAIPNPCTASEIFENAVARKLTLLANSFSRSCAIRSACPSRSRLINRPDDKRAAMAAEWPPAPSVAST